jgi:ribosomal subunit interface protein
MKTTVKARNVELSSRLRIQIDRKLRRLDRIAHPGAEASVELTANASRAAETANVAEVTLVSNGSVLRSTSSGPTLIAALDRLIDKLERQLIRARERPRSVRGRQSDQVEAVLAQAGSGAGTLPELELEPVPGLRGEPSVVKVKRFDMVPMFEEDAICRMEALGHAFFVFVNAEASGVCVVYRRSDGGYGLIEPIIEPQRRR